MKKLLIGSAILLMTSLSILIFQISCSKPATAQTSDRPLSQIGKIIFTRNAEIWTANYDGTGQTQVPITLPPNISFAFGSYPQTSLAISPDGQKIFFSAYSGTGATRVVQLYAVNFDGTNLDLIIDNGPSLGFYPVIAF